MKIYVTILVSLTLAAKAQGDKISTMITTITNGISSGINQTRLIIGTVNNASRVVAHTVANVTRKALNHWANKTDKGFFNFNLGLEYGKVKLLGEPEFQRKQVRDNFYSGRTWADYTFERVDAVWSGLNSMFDRTVEIVDHDEDSEKGPIRKLFDTVKFKAANLPSFLFHRKPPVYVNTTLTPRRDPETTTSTSSSDREKGSFRAGFNLFHISKPVRPTALKHPFPNLKITLNRTHENFNTADSNNFKQDDDRVTEEPMSMNNIAANKRNEIDWFNKKPSENENEVIVFQGPIDYTDSYMHYNDFNNNAISFGIDVNNSTSNAKPPLKGQDDKLKELLDNSLV